MRTTLTLDDDLAEKLHEVARRKGESFKAVVNSTLRRGLQGEKRLSRFPKFKVTPKASGFRSGVDVLHLNQLNDDLEMEDSSRTARSRGMILPAIRGNFEGKRKGDRRVAGPRSDLGRYDSGCPHATAW